MPSRISPEESRRLSRSHHRTYTIPVPEAVTQEHAISLACARFNELYDDGILHRVRRTSGDGAAIGTVVASWEVSFLITGSYIGPYGPADRPDEDAHR